MYRDVKKMFPLLTFNFSSSSLQPTSATGPDPSPAALSVLSIMCFASSSSTMVTAEGDARTTLPKSAAKAAEGIVCDGARWSEVHEFVYAIDRVEYLIVHNGTEEFQVGRSCRKEGNFWRSELEFSPPHSSTTSRCPTSAWACTARTGWVTPTSPSPSG